MVVMTRLLPVEAVGSFALASYLASLVMLQPKMAAGDAFLQRGEGDARSVGSYAALDLGLALASVLPALVALPLVPRPLRGLFAVLVAAGILQGLANPLVVLLERELAFGRAAALQAGAATLSYVPAVWLAARGAGAWSLVAQNLALALLTLGGTAWVNRAGLARVVEGLPRSERALCRDLSSYALAAGGTAFVAAQAGTVDTLLVGSLLGTTALGYYDRGSRTAQWPSLLLLAASGRTAVQAFARLRGEPEALGRAFSLSTWLVAATAFPLAAALFVAAPDLVTLLFGARWLPSVPILRLLVVASALRPLWENGVVLLNGIGKPRVAAGLLGLQLVGLVLLGIPLTLWLGAAGAAAAVSASLALGLAAIRARIRRELPSISARVLLAPAIAALGALGGGLGLVGSGLLDGMGPLPRLVLEAGAVAAVDVALLVALEPKATRERLATVWRLSRPA